MAELIAKGEQPSNRWRRPLVNGDVVRLGRAPAVGWAVPWDGRISREHVEIAWHGERLAVRVLPGARNPAFFRGQAATDFTVGVGEHFVIGGTTFQVGEEQASIALSPASPREEHTFRADELRRVQFSNADHRLEVLSNLPALISDSTSDDVFSVHLVGLLLAGIPHAEAVALVQRGGAATPSQSAASPSTPLPSSGARGAEESGTIHVRQWDRRQDAAGRFQPSQRLIVAALDRGESVLHVWADRSVPDPTFTATENLDWAFCTPVPGEACRGWCLYVAGGFGPTRLPGLETVSSREQLTADIRFAELVAQLIGALRQVRLLERQRSRLRKFFSPGVAERLSGDPDHEPLAPKETDVTVLFCDLRGFSKEAEHWRGNLEGLLNRVSEALGVMTQQIFQNSGVLGDYQGDSAMGFWGWPESQDAVLACQAALGIRAVFQHAANDPGHTLADFRVGIGVAHGRAVAGQIGTSDQSTVTAFGPVVNLASRLEGMTKQLRVPILIDESTAEFIRKSVSRDVCRCRRLGRVRPYGIETALMVSELLPPADHPGTLSDQNIDDYEAAVDAVITGRWPEALELLHQVPAKDRAKDFLTIFIAQHNYEPPLNWDGVIPMPSK